SWTPPAPTAAVSWCVARAAPQGQPRHEAAARAYSLVVPAPATRSRTASPALPHAAGPQLARLANKGERLTCARQASAPAGPPYHGPPCHRPASVPWPQAFAGTTGEKRRYPFSGQLDDQFLAAEHGKDAAVRLQRRILAALASPGCRPARSRAPRRRQDSA